MGNSLNAEEGIFHYFIFQKKIQSYLEGKQYAKDNTKMKEGYILHSLYVSKWKQIINYRNIEDFLIKSGIKSKKIDSEQKKNINEYIRNQINLYYYNSMTSIQINRNNYLQVENKIIDKNYLEKIVSNKIFYSLVQNPSNHKEKINYILKKQMLILFFPNYHMIKMVISDLSPFDKKKKIVNLTFQFSIYYNDYGIYVNKFAKESSAEIINFLMYNNILGAGCFDSFEQNRFIYRVYNEEKYLKENYNKQIKQIIKAPHEINFALLQRPSYRGLDNVGATCYMNATLQCLANIL